MPTYYYVQNQGKLMQNQENGQKPKSGQFVLRNYKFFSEISFIQIEGHI